jgi:hypothetical protein
LGGALDGGWVSKHAQELSGSELLAGEAKVGADLGQGLEHEAAQVEARVRNDDGRCRKGEVPNVKDVEVDGAGGVARSFGGAAHGGLNFLECFEQGSGEAAVAYLDDGI